MEEVTARMAAFVDLLAKQKEVRAYVCVCVCVCV